MNMINSGLKNLKKEINEMSEKEKEIEEPDVIVEIVEDILKFNKQKQKQKGNAQQIAKKAQKLNYKQKIIQKN